MEIKGKLALILGFGKEGKSVFNFLQKNYPKLRIGIADKKKIKNSKASEIFCGENYLDSINSGKYETIIRSPGVKYGKELLEFKNNGGNITTLINIFFSLAKGKIVGITGTKGKSTTSSLIYKILKTQYKDVRLVGNIGKPALDYLKNQTKDTIFVCELSSQQLEDIKYSPHASVFLNVVADHINYHGSFKTYLNSKKNIFRFQKSGDIFITNPDYKIISPKEIPTGVKIINFGLKLLSHQVYFENNSIYGNGEKIIDQKDIPLIGRGNIENVMAAISASLALGCDIKNIGKTIKKFKSLPHRMEFAGEFKGVKYYNDSMSTVPEVTIHALEGLKEKGERVEVLIAGGSDTSFDKGGNYEVLGKFLGRSKDLRHVVIFPQTGKIVLDLYKENNPKGNLVFHDASNMKDAVGICKKYCSKGSTCLLSPGSTSFGVFKDYKDRGNQFKKLAKNL